LLRAETLHSTLLGLTISSRFMAILII
jgi:hypothetical protein